MNDPTVEEVRKALVLWDYPSRRAVEWEDQVVLAEAARLFVDAAEPDIEAGVNAFWSHAADLLKPTIESSGIDRAVGLAIVAAHSDNNLIRRADR